MFPKLKKDHQRSPKVTKGYHSPPNVTWNLVTVYFYTYAKNVSKGHQRSPKVNNGHQSSPMVKKVTNGHQKSPIITKSH